jgi:hypothetical protein
MRCAGARRRISGSRCDAGGSCGARWRAWVAPQLKSRRDAEPIVRGFLRHRLRAISTGPRGDSEPSWSPTAPQLPETRARPARAPACGLDWSDRSRACGPADWQIRNGHSQSTAGDLPSCDTPSRHERRSPGCATAVGGASGRRRLCAVVENARPGHRDRCIPKTRVNSCLRDQHPSGTRIPCEPDIRFATLPTR